MKTLLTKQLFTILLFIVSISNAFSQIYEMDGTPITDCSGFFHDSSAGGSYAINENFSTTICGDQTTGTHIQLQFSSIDIGVGDIFQVYDANTADPDFLMDTDFLLHPTNPFILQASVINPSGCLTIVFTSNDIDDGNMGWGAAINCIPSCQNIIANLSSSLPEVMPLDTGWIDICLGDEILFSGNGIFPQNAISYIHTNETCTFEWHFGDGTTAEGINASHTYNSPGGYTVQLKITDQFGCQNTNYISQRVRISPAPTFVIDDSVNDVICSGDTVLITSGLAPSVDLDVIASPNEGVFSNGFCSLDTLLLPDGIGAAYQQTIFITEAIIGETIESIDDFLNVSLSIEHSYGGDLDIELICPNGSSILILDYPSGIGSTNFGEPFASTPVDGQSNDLTLGVPYTYVFVNNAINGTLRDFDNLAPVYTYTTVPSLSTGISYIYTDSYFPAGEYEPEQAFSNLIGCPINGEWTLQVEDNLGLDNGWITGWCINFAGHLISFTETFTPTITNWGWDDNPTIIAADQDSVEGSPSNPGTAAFTFWTLDDFGCLNDTSILIDVLSSGHPNCGPTFGGTPPTAVVIRINPDPTESTLEFSIPTHGFSQMEVYNNLGQKLGVQVISAEETVVSIDVSHLSSGVYYVLFRGEKSVSVLKKVIKLRGN